MLTMGQLQNALKILGILLALVQPKFKKKKKERVSGVFMKK